MKREICIECTELANCRVRESLPQPIIDCDRFQKRDDAASRKEGLCASCQLRDACERRQVEGGVWHCADYL